MLVKIYGKPQEEVRYSPADCLGCKVFEVAGTPDPAHVSTVLCGETEPHDENEYAPLYAPDQRL